MIHGERVEANYHELIIESHRGNPFLEALGNPMSTADALRALRCVLPEPEPYLSEAAELRIQRMWDSTAFLQPLPQHLELWGRIATLLRCGYQGRNPLQPAFQRALRRAVRGLAPATSAPTLALGKSASDRKRTKRAAPSGLAVIGRPGIGKSLCVEAILDTYPQVIVHSSYNGRLLPRHQLVWLKLDCPKGATLKGFCVAFLAAVDGLLGTSYVKAYCGPRSTLDTMKLGVVAVAGMTGLGVLVIDEIQNLRGASRASNAGDERRGPAHHLLEFLVEVMNTTGAPVIAIGTPDAVSVLGSLLRMGRRLSGQGDFFWEPMSAEVAEGEKTSEWAVFFRALSRYQYTTTSLHEGSSEYREVSDALFAASTGIAMFAVTRFFVAQERVIGRSERVTKNVINSVKDRQRLAEPHLSRLRGTRVEQDRDLADLFLPLAYRAASRTPPSTPEATAAPNVQDEAAHSTSGRCHADGQMGTTHDSPTQGRPRSGEVSQSESRAPRADQTPPARGRTKHAGKAKGHRPRPRSSDSPVPDSPKNAAQAYSEFDAEDSVFHFDEDGHLSEGKTTRDGA